MLKTIGFGEIDWTGLKSVLIHAFLLGLGAIVMYIEQIIIKHDFGQYQILATAINTLVIHFLVKFFGTYDVPIDTTQV